MKRTKAALATVRLPLGKKSYEIQIGPDAVGSIGKWIKGHSSRRAYVIADERLTEARQALLAKLTSAGWTVHEIPVTAGEKLKDIESVYPLYGELLKAKADRNALLFALGG